MLPVINSGGMFAHCSDLIVGSGYQNQVHYLSLAGHQGPVKGILAALLEGKNAWAEIKGSSHCLIKTEESYRIITKKLPSGRFQGAIFLQSALQNEIDDQVSEHFLMLSNDSPQSHLELFHQLQARLAEIPLHRAWAQWLWRLYQDQGWLLPSVTLAGPLKGFMVELHPQSLHEAISEGLNERDPDLSRCFANATAVRE
jgi:hypothetical protein